MPQTVSQFFSQNVVTLLTISTASLPNAVQNQAYSKTLAASGGTTPYSWALTSTSGPLPTGIAFSTAGVFSGTPTVFGSFPITVQVDDAGGQTATMNYTLVVAAPLAITTTSVPQAIVGVAYSFTFQASGGITPYVWSTTSGILPNGLTLSSAGVLSGTATTTGSGPSQYTVKVVDSGS